MCQWWLQTKKWNETTADDDGGSTYLHWVVCAQLQAWYHFFDRLENCFEKIYFFFLMSHEQKKSFFTISNFNVIDSENKFDLPLVIRSHFFYPLFSFLLWHQFCLYFVFHCVNFNFKLGIIFLIEFLIHLQTEHEIDKIHFFISMFSAIFYYILYFFISNNFR